MTEEEKNRVLELRASGKGARAISKVINVPENTIKTYLRRHPFADVPIKPEPIEYPEAEMPRCKWCKKPVIRYEGKRPRLFCGDSCRMAWWKEHQELINKKAIYEYECAYCHKPFTAYGNSTRKYCSHECYVSDRYGG